MILLRKELCWEWEDVLYFVTNARADRKELDPATIRSMENWNKFDFMIYDHFNKTLWEKIRNYENFDQDKELFEGMLADVHNKCLAGEKVCNWRKDRNCQYRPHAKVALKSFELSEEGQKSPLCKKMILPELKFSSSIFRNQFPGWKNFYNPRIRE